MIGQKKLMANLDHIIASGFPRFTIIAGPKGSGKKTLAKGIADKLGARLIISSIKVDDIREVIDLAYKQSEPTIYLLPDTDRMSIAAKNSLLKITEEPPRQSYFIMTLEDAQNALNTLRSRGQAITLDPYSPLELEEYGVLKGYNLNDEENRIISEICLVPGDVDTILRYNVMEFYGYVNKVINSIGKVNGANAFKIPLKLNLTKDDGGWDAELFLRAIMAVYADMMKEDPSSKIKESILITSKYLQELKITGIHKPSTMDMWVMELKGVWSEWI